MRDIRVISKLSILPGKSLSTRRITYGFNFISRIHREFLSTSRKKTSSKFISGVMIKDFSKEKATVKKSGMELNSLRLLLGKLTPFKNLALVLQQKFLDRLFLVHYS